MLKHGTKTLERAVKMLLEGIKPSSLTDMPQWAKFPFVFLTAEDRLSTSAWGNYTFFLDENWVEKNRNNFYVCDSNQNTGGYSFQPFFGSEVERQYHSDKSTSRIRAEGGQVIHCGTIPPEAISAIVTFSYKPEEAEKAKELLKYAKPGTRLIIDQFHSDYGGPIYERVELKAV